MASTALSEGVCFALGFAHNGKENGDYYSILGESWGYMGIMDKKMEATIVEYIPLFPIHFSIFFSI